MYQIHEPNTDEYWDSHLYLCHDMNTAKMSMTWNLEHHQCAIDNQLKSENGKKVKEHGCDVSVYVKWKESGY